MWEERYAASGDFLFGRAPAAFLRENPGWAVPGREALCVADGEGRNSVWLAQKGVQVVAFDGAPTAVERARSLAKDAGVSPEYAVADWGQWDWSRAFDMVVAVFIQFMGPEARAGQFADLRRAVKPGGILLLHGYRPEQVALGTGGPPSEANMYTEALLLEAFGDWEVLRLASYERDVQEGRGHRGKSALIDLIVRRPVM
ncbi:MAG TPA: class I SAM-dependent methyltransferase [Aliiroseovarius sp.]|nr:class I SAM-dependent methyltransferase [Aliiroseovarius sp.]